MSSLLAHKSLRVKKSTHGSHPAKGGEVGPVDVLIDREQQWKHITKSLLNWAKGMSAIESATAKSTLALCDTIQVPFHEGHVFLGEGGWQEVLYSVRDKTKHLSELHSSLAATLDKTVVQELEGVRSEIKAHIAAIEKEAGVLAQELAKERTASAQHLTTLQQGIDTFENSSEHMLPQHDPLITHTQAVTQLTKQMHKENDFQVALIRFQQQQPSFEAGISKSIQSALKMYDEAKLVKATEIAKVEAEIQTSLQSVAPDAEYNYFATKPGYILDPNTPLRSVENVAFPGLHHASTVPIKEGILERKRRYTKSYKEAYYVLSPSGYLHERKSNDDTNAIVPTFSLFLPECSLSAPSKADAKSHKIHVEGNRAVHSSIEGKMKSSLRFGSKEIAYSLRARTHAEMLGWWEALDKVSRDTKSPVVTTSKVAASPIDEAVANIGRAGPATEPTVAAPTQEAAVEEEEEEGGSSAEEEEEEARTAPSTPAPLAGMSSPLDGAVVEAEAKSPAEILPTYQGDGTTVAEKEALAEKGKPGFLGSLFGSSSPAASTSA